MRRPPENSKYCKIALIENEYNYYYTEHDSKKNLKNKEGYYV